MEYIRAKVKRSVRVSVGIEGFWVRATVRDKVLGLGSGLG